MCVFFKKKEFVCVHVSASYIVLMHQIMCVCVRVCVCKDRSHVWKQSESMNSWSLEDSLS